MDTVDTEPHLEELIQHVGGRLAVPGASATAKVNVFMDSGSGNTAMSDELVEALRRQPGMIQTALTQTFIGHTRVVTSLGQECDIVTQSCPLHLTIKPHGDQSGLRCRSSCSQGEAMRLLSDRRLWGITLGSTSWPSSRHR